MTTQSNSTICAKISEIFHTTPESVADVFIDEEFGNVTATVDGKTNVDCGFIEEF